MQKRKGYLQTLCMLYAYLSRKVVGTSEQTIRSMFKPYYYLVVHLFDGEVWVQGKHNVRISRGVLYSGRMH